MARKIEMEWCQKEVETFLWEDRHQVEKYVFRTFPGKRPSIMTMHLKCEEGPQETPDKFFSHSEAHK